MTTAKLSRGQGPAASATFHVKRGLSRGYAPHDGPVFEVEYTDAAPTTAHVVNPECELSPEAEMARITARPWEIRDAVTTYWATREAAEAEARRLLDEADPRTGIGRGEPVAESCTRRDTAAVWWVNADGAPLWRVTATVREFRQVIESSEGVTVCLRRAPPNDEGRVAELTAAADDATYHHTTSYHPSMIGRMSADGARSERERAVEAELIGRALSRTAELGGDVAEAVAAAGARGDVCAYPVGA